MAQWLQTYDPFQNMLLSALAAAIPLLLFFYLLAVRRMAGYKAAAICGASALILSVFLWKMPPVMALSAAGMGAMFGLFPIVWIIVTAVWIYNMTVESGEFEKIKSSLGNLTGDRRLQAILLAFAFSAFLEGAAGFGTPVAIAAAMLTGLGFSPFYAAGICLVANSAPAAFGGIGIPIVVSGDVSSLDTGTLSHLVGTHLAILSFFIPFWICVIMCGVKRSFEVWPALLVGGGSFSLLLYATASVNGPALPDIVAGVGTVICLVALFKIWKPKTIWQFPEEASAQPGNGGTPQENAYTPAQVLRSWLPYILVTGMVFVFGHKGYQAWVSGAGIEINWPFLHNLAVKTAPIVATDTPYAAIVKINVLASSGTAIFIAGILSAFVMPGYGPGKAAACFVRTLFQLRYSILTICVVLALAYVMNYSGISSTLGMAFTLSGALFPFFAPVIGWMGVFLTGSDTSANALFSNLQRTTGEAIGVDPNLMVAANSSGGVTGKMISPQSVSVAAAATGQTGREGELFRFTLRHSLIMLLMVCAIVFIQSYWGR